MIFMLVYYIYVLTLIVGGGGNRPFFLFFSDGLSYSRIFFHNKSNRSIKVHFLLKFYAKRYKKLFFRDRLVVDKA
jgi:hypothetical protein